MAPNQAQASIAEEKRTRIALEEYKEVLIQFRALTDIRFKLLTFLPLGTVAAAVFVPTASHIQNQPAISAFAFVVTLCIATYDKRNDQHYDELVSRAAELERELQIERGTFLHRPRPWLQYGFVPVEHRWPIGLVYAAAASLWAYLFTAPFVESRPGWRWLVFAAPSAVVAGWLGLRRIEKARRNQLRSGVRSLMTQLLQDNDPNPDHSQDVLVKAIKEQPIFGFDPDADTVDRRVAFHWGSLYQQKRGSPRAASALLSAIIDLPARWIEDVWSGRR